MGMSEEMDMVRLTFNPFKLRTVAHYAYEYVAMHGDVVRGKFTHTKPEEAFKEGYKLSQLWGRFPLQVRVVNERGEIVQPPAVASWSTVQETVTLTQAQLVQALKDAQAAHHKHEAEELANMDLTSMEARLKAAELSNSWVEWYVAHIFRAAIAPPKTEIVGTL